MSETQTVATYDVNYLQFINENREATQALPDFADDDTLLFFYRQIVMTRFLDTKASNLQRTCSTKSDTSISRLANTHPPERTDPSPFPNANG